MMLAEWGVFHEDEYPEHQKAVFEAARYQMAHYPRLKAIVYFESPNAEGRNSEVHLNDDTLEAFKEPDALAVLRRTTGVARACVTVATFDRQRPGSCRTRPRSLPAGEPTHSGRAARPRPAPRTRAAPRPPCLAAAVDR